MQKPIRNRYNSRVRNCVRESDPCECADPELDYTVVECYKDLGVIGYVF